MQWLLEGKRYSEKVVSLFHQHYVQGVPRVAAAKELGFSQPFASKKFVEFDALILEKCEQEGLVITTVLHEEKDLKKVLSLDSVVKRFK